MIGLMKGKRGLSQVRRSNGNDVQQIRRGYSDIYIYIYTHICAG